MVRFNLFQNAFFRNFRKREMFAKIDEKILKRGKRLGTISLMISPILFEVKHKDEEITPKNEYIYIAGKSIDFLTQKIFENEFGTSILYLTFFIAYLALLVHDNRVNLMVQKLKFRFANNFFHVGHPNYKKYLPPNPLTKKENIKKEI